MRLNLIITLAFTLSVVAGCNSIEKESGINFYPNNLHQVELNSRSYFFAEPKKGFNKNKSYKLLLAFHGAKQNAKLMAALSAFESASSNYIVVYPQSELDEWNEGCNCNKPYRLGVDDLGYIENLVADIKSKYNIIEDELYAAGFSQGGLFVQNLMCNSKLKFTAIASVASSMSEPLSKNCAPKYNTNYLMIHGTDDKTFPYSGLNNVGFGLIPSQSAIKLIAKNNQINSKAVIKENEIATKYTYKNNKHNIQLVAIKAGTHSWEFEHFNTTNEIVNFFDSVSTKKLDNFSSLYRIEHNKDVHIRSMGLEHSGPAIILLSGFNKNYHSDSAWFALLQPLIAKSNRVYAIERFGNGFSSSVEQPSYRAFAQPLDNILQLLDEKELIIVSFASANITALNWQSLPNANMTKHLKGMVWIDPDILLPHSISLYQDWPVTWYRQTGEKLLSHIAQSGWTARTVEKITNERTTVSALIPEKYEKDMDWTYFDLISQGRVDINKQLTRAKEVINYHDDLVNIDNTVISTNVPITVIDSDFESYDIEKAEPENINSLKKWQQEGTQWSKLISQQSGGQYIPLISSDHMVVFQHPDIIIKAIADITKK